MSLDEERRIILGIIGEADYVKIPSELSRRHWGIAADNGGSIWLERYTFTDLAVSGAESFLDSLLELLDERPGDENGKVELLDQEMEALELESDMMQVGERGQPGALALPGGAGQSGIGKASQ